MGIFKYRSRGTANTDWQQGEIEADDREDAQDQLDEIFGIERDDDGKQLTDTVTVELLDDGKGQ